MGHVTHHETLTEPAWDVAHGTAHMTPHLVGVVTLPLHQATGRVLAHDLRSATALPRDTTSAMDGYAVGDSSGPWRLVDAPALAGHVGARELEPGEAVVIATGGVVPHGTFGVVRREYAQVTSVDGGEFISSVSDNEPWDGSHVRPAGAEASLDEVIVHAGQVLTPPRVGLAAMAGVDTVRVRRSVTVDLIVLGDEVTHRGVPGAGQVRDAFAPQFPAYLQLLGVDVTQVMFVPDTLDATVRALRDSDADVIITTGGTAAGPRDHLHRGLEAVGAELVIDSIAMRPGHPNLLARRDGQYIVGLPGNPLSATLGGMLTLVRPLVYGLLGRPAPVLGQVVTADAVVAPARDSRLVPFSVSWVAGRVVAQETGWLGSGMLRGFACADGVMVIPPGGVGAGCVVPSLALPWGSGVSS
ncbi:molybdopterin molybdotransferase MoeA [Jonesia denitrificans]|uniref:Molybdopterin molybdenumtransferase n=1 Tax=Jonesia denitrificans (strain ATCC 14870 / DSM 20603 / BCRC 15368 / CIP 55.134 / JCM 11481 / NBRC 15587 / NCTC 10816 / Prevot 55134) TaxID=471856 RepID=C7R438_JONDD|nr:molybdopterin molybdotransferase MoeA [Jonesia denitrificans]ACV08895.1 molybdopterin binding domain protein [Jonesia denitrificans DSM 20603]ASE09792.1 molybdopterin molybdenumtransferase MoeA [Jonesia denitrificans]QXB44329.1 molybdopterin molybdotransferase MoeA [Jonesia denitrificans]SQH20936.1 Molybdopterin molybdenumtransferase [Jonesia denitrificans]